MLNKDNSEYIYYNETIKKSKTKNQARLEPAYAGLVVKYLIRYTIAECDICYSTKLIFYINRLLYFYPKIIPTTYEIFMSASSILLDIINNSFVSRVL